MKKLVWPITLAVYLACVWLVFTIDNEPGQFFLGLPWIVVVTMLGMAIGHAGGVDALRNSQLICYGINAIILLFLSVRRLVNLASEE